MAIKLITTNTSSNAASSSFTSSIDSTYKLYVFKFYDVNPVSDNVNFTFQANAVGASGYNETMTTTFFRAYHTESDSEALIAYSNYDQHQGTAYQILGLALGSDADQSCTGEFHLFNPSNTTYVKHFHSRVSANMYHDYAIDEFVGGYINTATAIDDIQFKMSSGNMDAVIKMYGVG